MRIDIKIIGQVPKDDLAPDSNEDSFDFSEQKGIVVISDGASESYDSKTLSKLICSHYLDKQTINQEWIQNLLDAFSAQIDIESLSWSKKAAYKRGSYATLLALKNNSRHNRIILKGIGDSFAVLLDEEEIIETFPYKTSSQFHRHPELISSVYFHNTFITQSNLKKKYKDGWDLESLDHPVILCMTDSLGEWMLRNYENKNPKWAELLELNDESALKDLVRREWDLKEMRKDDITLIRIVFKR